jgi:hypothetical protein
VEFEFAAKASSYIRHSYAVVTVGNGDPSLCFSLIGLKFLDRPTSYICSAASLSMSTRIPTSIKD